MTVKGEGNAFKWLMRHKEYPDKDWCLVWPFARDKHGRGMLGYLGQRYWAHRFMCSLVHGYPPTPDHTAAHTCGNGHGGCVNPHHLAWKTQAENLEDCRAHGTIVRHHGGNVRRLMPEESAAIKGARGFQTQGQLAAKYGVSEGTISDIWHGRTHTRESKIPHWKPEEVQKLREALAQGMSLPEATGHVGTKSLGSVTAKTYRLGLKSGRPPTRDDYSSVRRS